MPCHVNQVGLDKDGVPFFWMEEVFERTGLGVSKSGRKIFRSIQKKRSYMSTYRKAEAVRKKTAAAKQASMKAPAKKPTGYDSFGAGCMERVAALVDGDDFAVKGAGGPKKRRKAERGGRKDDLRL